MSSCQVSMFLMVGWPLVMSAVILGQARGWVAVLWCVVVLHCEGVGGEAGHLLHDLWDWEAHAVSSNGCLGSLQYAATRKPDLAGDEV